MGAGQAAVHPVGVLRVRLSVLTGHTRSLLLLSLTYFLHKGSSLAVEAAESLLEVLLVLHTCSVPSEGEVFVIIAGPLSGWRFCCVTNQPDEERCHTHLKHQ